MVVRSPIRPSLKQTREIGPRDHGREISEQEYLRCTDRPGFVSEIIDGMIHVSPGARPLHNDWQLEIALYLKQVADRRPRIINHVATDNDVVIRRRSGPTRPRPDITAYRDFPPREKVALKDDWSEYAPILAIEVISRRRSRKDTLRNCDLYWQEPRILEYWIVDPRKEPLRPATLVHAREPGQPAWIEYRVPFGATWESKVIRGLTVNLSKLRYAPD